MRQSNVYSISFFIAILHGIVSCQYARPRGRQPLMRPNNQYNNYRYLLPYMGTIETANRWQASNNGLYNDEPDTIGQRFGSSHNRPQAQYTQWDDTPNYLDEWYKGTEPNALDNQMAPNPISNQNVQQNEAAYGMDGYSEDNPIQSAVFSHHETKVYTVPHEQTPHYHEPTVIKYDGKVYPIYLEFSSYSSPLVTKHEHIADHTIQQEESHSVDHAHHLVHTVTRPLVHEVREVIKPHQNVYRVVKPMRENVQTYVHQRGGKEDPMQHYYRFHGYAHSPGHRANHHEHHQKHANR